MPLFVNGERRKPSDQVTTKETGKRERESRLDAEQPPWCNSSEHEINPLIASQPSPSPGHAGKLIHTYNHV